MIFCLFLTSLFLWYLYLWIALSILFSPPSRLKLHKKLSSRATLCDIDKNNKRTIMHCHNIIKISICCSYHNGIFSIGFGSKSTALFFLMNWWFPYQLSTTIKKQINKGYSPYRKTTRIRNAFLVFLDCNHHWTVTCTSTYKIGVACFPLLECWDGCYTLSKPLHH